MIGQDSIDRIRQTISLVELVGETVKLQRRGRSWVGLCPFHKEKTPSFHVNDERGSYHCFGCQAHGDAFRFVQEIEGMDFVEAVHRLAERAGVQIVETASDADRKQQAEARRRTQELYDVNAAAAVFFEQMLERHPLSKYARAELERRGLQAGTPEPELDHAAETLRAFRIGYAPHAWDGLAEYLKEAGLSHQAAERVGLLVPRKNSAGHYDRFRHRLMFAIIDVQGRVIAFSGRALPEPSPAEVGSAPSLNTKPDPAPAKYINSPESPIYRKREALFGLYQSRAGIRSEQACVLVEGNFDVVSLHARGVEHVVAPLGTALSAEQARQIKRYVPTVTLLFDGDAAGKKAVLAAREPCRSAGLEVRVAELPNGLDPDELIRKRGRQGVEQLLRAARGQLEYLIDALLDRGFRSDDARGKAAKIKQILELLADEDDPAVRAMAEQHANRIAERLGIQDVRTLRALARNVQSALKGHPNLAADHAQLPATARSRNRREDVCQQILGSLLDYPELTATPELGVGVRFIEGDYAAAIAALRQNWTGQEIKNIEQVLAKMAAPIHSFARARLAAPKHERLKDARAELFANLDKLKNRTLSQQKIETLEELERAARLGDFDTELELLRAQERRARERHGLH